MLRPIWTNIRETYLRVKKALLLKRTTPSRLLLRQGYGGQVAIHPSLSRRGAKRKFPICKGSQLATISNFWWSAQQKLLPCQGEVSAPNADRGVFCRKALVSITVFLSLFAQTTASDLRIWLEPTNCLPGEIVKLHAELSSGELSEFELKVPQHSALHFVEKHKLPVEYSEQIFTQKSVWTLQAIQPGTVELNALSATIRAGGDSKEVTLAPLSFNIESYSADDPNNEAMPFPADSATAQRTRGMALIWLVLLLALFTVAIIIQKRRTSAKVNEADSHKHPTLHDLEHALANNELSTALIEGVLADPSISLSTQTRETLERAAYKTDETTSAEALLDAIRKEPKT